MTEKPVPKKTVLLIHDNPAEIETIQQALSAGAYIVNVVRSAREAFTTIFKAPPDIIILDINLPDLDGLHVAKELKRNMMLRHIPVILLTGRIDFLEKMKSLDVMVDEYIVRPFDSRDLLVRTELVISRLQSSLDANPLTRLPGNNAIVRMIKSKIGQGKPYAVGYADLNNFKSYNDKYGFNRGDGVINLAARIIVGAAQKFCPRESFVGHVGGDDFIFICGYEQANDIAQTIIESFDKEIPRFYSEEDRHKGTITVEDRRGVVSQFPVVSISIGMVSDEGTKFANIGQINHSLTQLKKYAKSFQGSAFVRDRRSLINQLAEFTWGPGSAAGSSHVLETITSALGSYLPAQVEEIIRNRTISVLFQPILDMGLDEVVGHESLVRGPAGTPLEFPDALFQTARTGGTVPLLDALCIDQILSAAQEFRKGIKLFVNVFPESLMDPETLKLLTRPDPRKDKLEIVFELSGSNRSSDPQELFETLMKLKAAGQRICVDATVVTLDHGLKELMDLKPHYIKLNMMTYKGMSGDNKKTNEFLQVVNVIREIGSEAICTKLESRSDSFVAVKSGVKLGQGFLFARPALPAATTVRAK